jgi:dimethylhistidine N-methyltransferase
MPAAARLERSLPAGLAAERREFAGAVLEGLSATPKRLACRYLYDRRGSALFEEITGLDEYYPTRAEIEILQANAEQLAAGAGRDATLVEFGSGSSRKTEILLDAMPELGAYVPIDVSQSVLAEARARLARRYPGLDIRPIVADFSRPVALPPDLGAGPRIGFFPGSTIGNLEPAEAVALLAAFLRMLAPQGRLIVGVDLMKDEARLKLAYDDPAGVTAAFNLNLLARINRELGANFDLAAFGHRAFYNDGAGRIEMHLVSLRDQHVMLGGRAFRFRVDETIHTENSYKYSVAEFQELARGAGFDAEHCWVDPQRLFAIHYLVAAR